MVFVCACVSAQGLGSLIAGGNFSNVKIYGDKGIRFDGCVFDSCTFIIHPPVLGITFGGCTFRDCEIDIKTFLSYARKSTYIRDGVCIYVDSDGNLSIQKKVTVTNVDSTRTLFVGKSKVPLQYLDNLTFRLNKSELK